MKSTFGELAVGTVFFSSEMDGNMVKVNRNDAVYHTTHPRHRAHPTEPWLFEQDEFVIPKETL